MRNFLYILVFILTLQVSAQELNCIVTINADQLQNSNNQVFSTLETAVSEYLNNTKWTNKNYKVQEKLNAQLR